MNLIRIMVAAAILLGGFLYWKWSVEQKKRAPLPIERSCANNLRQIGLAFKVWSNDNQGEFPFNVSTNSGGSREWCAYDNEGFDIYASKHFEVMSNELNTPLLLICPQDKTRKPAANFIAIRFENVTYRLRTGTNISRAQPKHLLLICPIDGNKLYSDGTVVETNPSTNKPVGPMQIPFKIENNNSADSITNASFLPKRFKLRTRVAEFDAEEKAQFAENFERRYKPAISNWCKAFAGRTPFGVEAVAADKLVERIGKDSSYFEYVFVVNGITLGLQDTHGMARVDYLNAPKETRKLSSLPTGQMQIQTLPVQREDVRQIVEAESQRAFNLHEIRITPTDYSSALQGGAFISVGGDPQNGATWDYDMVFGPDGKLVFYLRGVDAAHRSIPGAHVEADSRIQPPAPTAFVLPRKKS